ncbi:MAG: hypothetical protein M1814_006047 [Vezdaea aestivalis]|nr:MAG: hypothetical protein M1814_006047 [Vezdaea aestivalis]
MADNGDEASAPVSEPLELVKLSLDEIVFIKLRGDRELKGRLHAYDSHCNLVLGDVEEIVYTVEEGEKGEDTIKTIKKQSEMLFVRGTTYPARYVAIANVSTDVIPLLPVIFEIQEGPFAMKEEIIKQTPQERRKGELALSEFTEYVERQQNKRYQLNGAANGAEAHQELEELDGLDFGSSKPAVLLRPLLLSAEEKSPQDLEAFIKERLNEGSGETLFDLGYEDNGTSMHLTKDEWTVALAQLTQVCSQLNADCHTLLTYNVGGKEEADSGHPSGAAAVGKIMIRSRPESAQEVIEIRIAVVGNVDAGKSTMLGVLVKGGLDDGRGKARVNLFRHKHEIETGRTSSVGMEIMGFDTKGAVVGSNVAGRKLSWEEIGNRSAKVITFADLAGHERYLRTTVFGLLSSAPNFALLMVAANNGVIGMSREHLGIACALNVPVMVVITKIDICPPQILEQTITQVTKLLKSPGAGKVPIMIKTREDCVTTAAKFVNRRICPIFQVSNVTGENLDLVRTFLNMLPHYGHYDAEAPLEFHVNDTFSVPFAGTVVSGVVKRGTVHEGSTVLIGPDSTGHFTTTTIRSIERKRIKSPFASAGQSASLALRRIKRKDVRKGMVVLPHSETLPKVHREFLAEVLILSHATTIKTKYQAMLHVGPVSQTCAIIDIDREYVRTGDRATVAFRFVQRPEYLTVGDRLLFREGRTKGLGIVKGLGYDSNKPLNPVLAGEGSEGTKA